MRTRGLRILELLEDRTVPTAFVPGSIQGQDGWSGGTIPIAPAVTQGVDQTGSFAHSGVGSWLVSNNTSLGNHNGAFAGWPFGPGLSVAAGQLSSGATANSFSATYYFRTASTVADGSNIEVDLGSTAGDDRTTFMAITNRADADGGLQIRMAEPNPADPGNDFFFPTQIVATGLTRGVWHRIDIQASFIDGASNDTFQVSLDGTPITNPTPGSPNNGTPNWGTFEGYWDGHGFSYVQSNRLYFRSGAAPSNYGAFSDTGAAGFAFDDISYKSFNSAAPGTTLASYGAIFEAAGATTGTVYVDDDWAAVPFAADPDGAGPATAMGFDAFATIQGGIDGVTTGGTVHVAAGTYPELVSVNKSVTLLGAQAGVDARTRTAVPESVVTGKLNLGGRSTAFYITASNVTVDGFTSQDQTDVDQYNAGIVMASSTSNVAIRNNIIKNNVIGIYAGSSGASLIERNLFDGNNNPGPAGATGIYSESTNGLTVDNNEFRNHNINSPVTFAAVGPNAHVNLNFTNNYLHDNVSGVLGLGITGGLFQGNTIRTTGGAATALAFGGAVTGVDVLYNNLSGNLRGLRISDRGFVPGSNPNADIEAHFNDFSNSVLVGAGIVDDGAGDGYTGALDLSGNWWGDVTGPTFAGNPGGTGEVLANAFNDTIDFEPWLVYSPDSDAAVAGVQLATSFSVAAQTGTFTTTNNNYRRLVNVVDLLQDGQTVTLSGNFNWNEPNAAVDWAAGNDGVVGNGDDYTLTVRPNLNGVTLTAASLGATTIQGPGDVASVNLEGFLNFDGGDNQNWTISNLQIFDFDLGIGMFFGAGGADAFANTKILNNHIRVPADLNTTIAPADVNQNIGIHYSFGKNQTIQGNQIDMAGDGVSDGANLSSTVGMQSNTSGGDVYDGLLIDGNTLRVLDAQSASPARILGIWENGHAHTSNITISNNQFLNMAAGNSSALNLQRAFRVTSHSGATSTVAYTGNTVDGANIGFEWLSGSNFAGNQAVRLTQNTITNSATGVLIQSSGIANLYRNTITGSGAGGGVHVVTGQLTAAGTVTHAVEQNVISNGTGDGIVIDALAGPVGAIFNNDLGGNTGRGVNNLSAAVVDASGNWWGVTTAAGVAAEVSANVDFTPWLGSGTDTSAASGFQGDFSTLYVGGASPQVGTTGRIGEAVGLVLAGGTVNVSAGTYAESVAVNKSVSILGAQDGVNPRDGRTAGDADESVVQATGGNAFTISAPNVTIGGFSVTGGVGGVYGIAETTPVTGTVVRDNFVYGLTSLGVAIAAGSSGFQIVENEVFNNYAGIYLSNTANSGTISGNVVRDHTGATFTDDGSGIVLEGDNQNISITQNEITGNRHGIYVWTGQGGANLNGTTVFENAITGNVAGVLNTNTATVLDASGNWWGVNTTAGVAAAAGDHVDFTPWLDTGADADPLTGFDGAFAILHVDDASPQVGTAGRIQEGVTLVDAGGTVRVAAGTYAESVAVSKAVSILGAQAGVNPTAGRTAGSAGESVVQATGGNALSISASGVTIDGFTITLGSVGPYGIAESTPVVGTEVHNSFVHGFTGGLGIAIASGSTGFDISSNDIFDNYAGVYLSNNAFGGTVSGNRITGHIGAPLNDGAGIVMEGINPDISITGNEIVGNSVGIFVATGFGFNLIGTTVFNNAIVGLTAGINNTNADTVLDASGNWWGVNTTAGVAAAAGANVDFTPWLDTGTDGDVTTAFDGDFSTLHVDDASPQVGTTGRINEAIGLVDASGTVRVAAGTYAENVSIDKSLSLIGEGTTTVIDPVSGTGIDIAVTGGTVVIQDLKVTGADTGLTATGLNVLTLSGVTLIGNVAGGTITDVPTVNLATDPGAVDETIDITPTTVTVVGQNGLAYSGVDTLNVSAGAGDDTFNVIPSVDTTINVDGGPHVTGDTLNVNALALGSTTTPTQVLVDGRQPIGYANIEQVNVAQAILFNGDLLITGTSGNDRIVVSMNLARTKVLVRINGVLAAKVPLADITGRIIVNALAGNDRVLVGTAVPVGADISGGDGNDRLNGGRGHDRIDGGAGNDTVRGRAGNDTLVVSAGLDVLAGAAGSDTVQGPDATAGWVIGALGAGRVNVDTRFLGVENLAGGTGDDTFSFRPLGSVKGTVDGGTGVNTLDYSLLAGGVRVSLAGGFATRTGGVANIANVVGGAGGDVLVGDGQANVLTGNAGRDILIGGGGADSLLGGTGGDILIGGSTTHDGSDATLKSLSAEWRRAIPYAKRVDHLSREKSGGLNGANVLTAATVVNDGGAIDSLAGGDGTDWFITFAGDTTDANSPEIVTTL